MCPLLTGGVTLQKSRFGMTTALVTGIFFGLTAGLAPGPLLFFLLSQTMRYGAKEGIKVAMTPLVTDLPIIAITLYLLHKVSDIDIAMGFISLAGAIFLVRLAWETTLTMPVREIFPGTEPRSLLTGAVINALSPHPYLFWITVGVPSLGKAMDNGGAPAAILFVAGFYILLTGSKALMAVYMDRSRSFLGGHAYLLVMRSLGALLFVCALIFGMDAYRLLSI